MRECGRMLCDDNANSAGDFFMRGGGGIRFRLRGVVGGGDLVYKKIPCPDEGCDWKAFARMSPKL